MAAKPNRSIRQADSPSAPAANARRSRRPVAVATERTAVTAIERTAAEPAAVVVDAAATEGYAAGAAENPRPAEPPRDERIRQAAYRRFEARGFTPDDELQDWLDAEAEVDGAADLAASRRRSPHGL